MADDLWDTPSPQESCRTPPGAIFDPSAISQKQQMKEDTIRQHGRELSGIVAVNEALVLACYELANYSPSERTELWDKILHPVMVKCLTDDVRIHGVVLKGMTQVSQLATIIVEAADAVNQAKGSTKSIEIAQKHIRKYYGNILETIKELKEFQGLSLATFAAHFEDILKIIGPKAADFVKQRQDLESQMRQFEKDLTEVQNKLCDLVEQRNVFLNLRTASQQRKGRAKEELDSMKVRATELSNLISTTEANIQAIPETVQVSVSRSSWFGWFRSSSTYNIKNPDKEGQKNYYQSLIDAREASRKRNLGDQRYQEEYMQNIEKDFAEFDGKVNKLDQEIKDYTATTAERVKNAKNRIVELATQIQVLNKTADEVANNIGLQGSVLLECLAAIRAFGQNMHEGVKVFQPLISTLETIITMCEVGVDMLLSSDKNDVFIGGRLLVNTAGFLSGSSIYLRQITEGKESPQAKKVLQNAKLQLTS